MARRCENNGPKRLTAARGVRRGYSLGRKSADDHGRLAADQIGDERPQPIEVNHQSVIPKKKRGPPPTGKGEPIMVRIHKPQLSRLDDWIASQKDEPSRPEAIRRIVLRGPLRGTEHVVDSGAHRPERERPKSSL
jgi:hypothetical protein